MTRFPINSFTIIILIKFYLLHIIQLILHQQQTLTPLCFDKFLAINNPILSEKISFPVLSITPTRSPSPSKPKPISALLSFTALAYRM